jgi:putative ABC transport system permease protein
MSGFSLVFRALISGPARRHPMRLFLPALGVAIGVAAVAAIHHANRSVTESFREAAATVAGRSDLVVTGVAGIPVSDLAKLSFLWPIASFAPAVSGPAVLADGSGEVVRILGVDWGGDAAVRDFRLVGADSPSQRARILAAGGSVLLPAPLAARRGLAAGATLPLVAGGRRHEVRVGGILELSGVARASGGDLLLTDLFTAQDLLGRRGTVDRVDVVLGRGASRDAVKREIAARLPPGLSVEAPGRAAETADRMVRAFRFNLNALGSLTLLVGMFLIANAVSIAVLRRRPEIATLRALGASRAAIFAAFLVEGLAIGIAGTAAGEVLGVFAARAALGSVAGTVTRIYLPSARIAAAAGGEAALLAAAVGIAAAVAATLLPALEATRVDPSPAMRPGSFEGAARRRFGWRAAGAALSLALAAAASRAPAVDGFPLFGFAAVVLVVAALALVSPLLVRFGAAPARRLPPGTPVEARLGGGLFGGAPARNGLAVTALAMALGMTLAMIVTVASIRSTVRIWVESTLRSDLWIKAEAGPHSGIVGDLPPDVLPFLRGIAGVAAVDPFRARDATDDEGRPYTVSSGDFSVVSRAGGLPMRDGRDPLATALAAKERGEVLVSEPYARRFGKREGDTVTLRTPSGPRAFRVAGVYYDYSNDRGTVVMDRALWLRLFGDERLTSVAVLAAPGVDAQALRRRILAAASGRFALSVTTNRELRREVLAIFDRTFAVTRALEGIALAVAVLGIAHALAASAVERRRAFGLLRAIGASGGQIRGATLVEALLSGGVGTLAALPAGAAFAWLLLDVINPQSFGWTVATTVPVAALAGAAGLVLLASLAAGIGPGNIAARVEPAAALQEE